MGKATISAGGDDGLYTAAVLYETKWVDTMREANEREIIKLQEQIVEVDVHIAETDQKIAAKKIALGQLLEIYQAVVAALNWQPPTHPDADDDGENLSDFDYGGGGGPNPWVKIISEHWAPERSYSRGDRVVPTWGGGNHHLCLEDGTSGAIEPSWARGRDAFTADGSIVWTCVWGLWVTQDVDVPDGPSTTSTGLSGWEITTDSASRGEDQVQTVLAPHSPPDMDPVLKAFSYLMRAMVEVKAWRDRKESYERYKAMLQYQIEALEKKNEEMDGATAEPAPQSMWCADLTEDLTGEVDTIEVKGAPDQILIGPAGSVGFAGSKLANVLAMSSAQAGLAWALLPGWQKWRPTYRVGTIHSIDYDADTASVTLDAATSIAQDLGVNQTDQVVDVPVEYMECDAEAFEDGDRVVVEFPGQLWEQGPKVIGFETNPQPCPSYCGIIGSTSAFVSLDDYRIGEWRQGADSPGASFYTPPPGDDVRCNNLYREGNIVRLGASWSFPWQFVDGWRFAMRLGFSMVIYDSDGGVIVELPIRIRYGATVFTPKDKNVGWYGASAFHAQYYNVVAETYCGSTTDTRCPAEVRQDQYPPYGNVLCVDETVHYYEVRNLHTQSAYQLNCRERFIAWADDTWGASAGVSSGDTVYAALSANHFPQSCPNEQCQGGPYCFTWEAFGRPDWLALADPYDQVVDKANLYNEQSWSMAGIIGPEGLALNDSTLPFQVGGHTPPHGPFENLYATAGPANLLTAAGLPLPPIEAAHHVGFRVDYIQTTDGKMAGITKQPVGSGSSVSLYDGGIGRADFYGFVSKAAGG